MRFLLLSAFLLAACSPEPATLGLAAGSYSGEGRDGLCVAGEGDSPRAGLIVYGTANTNCSASGRLEKASTGWALIPAGDSECRIQFSVAGNSVKVGEVPAACSYYCGPGASLEGHAFSKDSAPKPVTDFAGDSLC